MFNAANGYLQAYAKYKKSHKAVNYFFIMRTNVANHAISVEVKNKDEYANPDNGKQQCAYIDEV